MSDFYKIITESGQSLTDIAIQEYGCFEGVFALLDDNAFLADELTAVFPAGYELQIREDLSFLPATQRDWANYMRGLGKKVNTHNDATLPDVIHAGETNAYLPDVMIIAWDWLAPETQTIDIDATLSGSFNFLVLGDNVSAAILKLNGVVTVPPFNTLSGDVLIAIITKINPELPAFITLKQ